MAINNGGLMKEFEILSFDNRQLFNNWLYEFCDIQPGIWLRIFKKNSEIQTVTYQEALEVALCFGWIDGLRKSYDDKSWIQRFTPRRSKSQWSKRNTLIAERLIKDDLMHPTGLKHIEAAKLDGRWENAY